MAKKKKCPEFENHERWLVAYADMMTLLFALFVVLYSITNVEIEKLKAVKKSFQRAFGMSTEEVKDAEGFPSGNSRTEGIFNKIKGTTSREHPTPVRNRRELAAIIATDAKTIQKTLEERLYGSKEFPMVGGAKDERIIYFNKEKDGIRVTLLARGFFSPSKTMMEFGATKILDGLAKAVKDLNRVIRVEGHTDNRPFYNEGLTNWELSSMRASAVVRYFVDKHMFQPQSIYAAGFADSWPIAPNDTPENRAMNRRVDIKILYDNPTEYQSPDKPQTESPEATPSF